MAKSKHLTNKYPNVPLTERQIKQIRKDAEQGVPDDTLLTKYKINSSILNTVKNMSLNLDETEQERDHRAMKNSSNLQKRKGRTGASHQDPRSFCLCGSGLEYGRCCGK